ncbi:MAG: hypothetical protein Aurels2KO_48280 [Aureliella sp.]
MNKLRCLTFLVLVVGLGVSCIACQVPVFRYALERWEPDPYRLVVLHDGKLDAALSVTIKKFNQGSSEASLGDRYRRLSTVDVTKTRDPRLLAIVQEHRDLQLPLLAGFYPERSAAPLAKPAFVERFNSETLSRLLESPARNELVKRLTSGESAVWIFLPSGDSKKDSAARDRLEKQLALDAMRLELPSAEEMEIENDVLAKAKIELKVAFSVLVVDRYDSREKLLVDMLLNSESDLRDFDEPIAFPVFGRGRVLYALVGKGIQSETIQVASSFIVGPCSCQVKEQNPGFDLLLDVPWADAVGSTLISEPIEEESTGPPRRLTIPPGTGKKQQG